MSFAEIFDVWYKIVHWCWFWVHSIGLSLWHTFAIKCTGFCSCSRVGALIFYQGDLWGGENRPRVKCVGRFLRRKWEPGRRVFVPGSTWHGQSSFLPNALYTLLTFPANFSHPATPLFISEQDQVKTKFGCLWEQFAPQLTCLCHKTLWKWCWRLSPS